MTPTSPRLGQIGQNDGDWNPRTSDAGFAVKNGRIDGDVILPAHR
jgi:hypothetical protein